MSFESMPDRGPLSEPGLQEFADFALKKSREAVASTRNKIDVSYGTDFYQKLDIFLPQNEVAGGLPVLVFMHGGGWRHGHKEWMGFLAPAITALPAIFISVNYRLAPETKFPAPLDDCLDALAWTHKNIQQFGGDSNCLFVGGHSAGGHYAALAALKPAELVKRGMPAGAIKGCFPVSAPMELRTGKFEAGTRREKIVRDLLARMEDGPDASPTVQTAGNRTPFLVTWGAKDVPGIIADGKLMYALLKEQPGGCEELEMPDCAHFATIAAAGDPNCSWTRKVTALMARDAAR